MRRLSGFRTLVGVLLVGGVALAQPHPQPLSDPLAPAVSKWLPPVVDLLVDPWALGPVAAPAVRTRWVPSNVDIVDPWANQATPKPARLANRPAAAEHSTIF